jgi:hypothetical protein
MRIIENLTRKLGDVIRKVSFKAFLKLYSCKICYEVRLRAVYNRRIETKNGTECRRDKISKGVVLYE